MSHVSKCKPFSYNISMECAKIAERKTVPVYTSWWRKLLRLPNYYSTEYVIEVKPNGTNASDPIDNA
jgi:hypothetical protein